MYELAPEVILYDNAELVDFCTDHPYWLSINGYVIKISKRVCNELKQFHGLEPKRVGDMLCNDFSECDGGCPLIWLCCNHQHEGHDCDITLYDVLERHKIDDKEVYNVFKDRLDKEVQ